MLKQVIKFNNVCIESNIFTQNVFVSQKVEYALLYAVSFNIEVSHIWHIRSYLLLYYQSFLAQFV